MIIILAAEVRDGEEVQKIIDSLPHDYARTLVLPLSLEDAKDCIKNLNCVVMGFSAGV